jgi:hypothetical protein
VELAILLQQKNAIFAPYIENFLQRLFSRPSTATFFKRDAAHGNRALRSGIPPLCFGHNLYLLGATNRAAMLAPDMSLQDMGYRLLWLNVFSLMFGVCRLLFSLEILTKIANKGKHTFVIGDVQQMTK